MGHTRQELLERSPSREGSSLRISLPLFYAIVSVDIQHWRSLVGVFFILAALLVVLVP